LAPKCDINTLLQTQHYRSGRHRCGSDSTLPLPLSLRGGNTSVSHFSNSHPPSSRKIPWFEFCITHPPPPQSPAPTPRPNPQVPPAPSPAKGAPQAGGQWRAVSMIRRRSSEGSSWAQRSQAAPRRACVMHAKASPLLAGSNLNRPTVCVCVCVCLFVCVHAQNCVRGVTFSFRKKIRNVIALSLSLSLSLSLTHTHTHTNTHTHTQPYRGQSQDSGRSFALAKTGDARPQVPAPRPAKKKNPCMLSSRTRTHAIYMYMYTYVCMYVCMYV
jgi:hypothetical protein